MVGGAGVMGMAYRVVAEHSESGRARAGALRRAMALGTELGAPEPAGETASRALHEARVAVESEDFSMAAVLGLLARVEWIPECESESCLVLAAAHLREARSARRRGQAAAASSSATAALSQLRAALAADPTNREGLALLDELEELSGYDAVAEELRRLGRG